MSKSGKKLIREDEKKVIQELQKSSKENISHIAKKLGFSRQKVWRILKKLENNKTIWGYHTIIDYQKLGLNNYIILLKRTAKPLSPEKLKTMLDGGIKHEYESIGVDVCSVFYVNGYYDFLLWGISKDTKLMKKFCENLNRLFEDCISEIKLLEVVFPLQKEHFDNPHLDELLGFFQIEIKDNNYKNID